MSAGTEPSSTPASAAAAAAAAPASSVAAAAAAGAGPSSAAPASSAAAAVAGVSAGSVFVKRSDDSRARFAPVEIFVGDAVGHLAERASLKLGWRTTAAYVDLFLVPDHLVRVVQRNPAREVDVLVDSNLCLATDALAEASISDRCCLIARLPGPPAAAPGECARAARSLPSRSPSRGAGGARGTCERFR